MKKIIILFVVIFIAFYAVYGCGAKQSAENEKLKVAATIFPIYDFARNIGGQFAEVVLIVPPGASPHTFSPSVADVKKLQGAKTVFYNGFGLDDWVLKIAKSAGIKKTVNVNKNLAEVVKSHNGNPHLWLNPDYAKEECKAILEILSQEDPAHKAQFEENYEKYVQEITETANALKKKTEALRNKNFIAFHPAYTYFAEFFGLNEIAVIEKTPGRKPTPKEITEIENLIKSGTVKVIFEEPQISTDIVEAIKEDTGVKVLVLDPLGGTDGRKSYIDLIKFDVEQVVKGAE